MNGIGLQAVLFVVLPLAVHAQSSGLFFWDFANAISSSLPTCTDLPIKLISVNGSSNGTGPYYMNAYALNGATETQLIGNDTNSLRWRVNFPPDSQLLLNVVDSEQTQTKQGSSGGVPNRVYKVISGNNLNCIPAALSNPPKDFTISSNLTAGERLETCGQFGFAIQGGIKPYKLTILTNDSPVITNVTMGEIDDGFTYVNRAAPDHTLLAAVSDLTGRWAVGNPHVNTFGSQDASCTGLASSSGLASILAAEAAEQKAAEKKRQTALLAGILTPVLVLLIAGGIGGWFWYRKRSKKNGASGGGGLFNRARAVKRLASTDALSKDMEVGDSNMNQGWQMQPPPQPQHQDGQVLSINSYLDGPSRPIVPQRSHTVASSATMGTSMVSSPTSDYSTPEYAGPATAGYATRSTSLASAGPAHGNARPGFSSFPRQSVRGPRGSAKAVEAGYSLDDEDNGAGPAPFSAAMPSSHFGGYQAGQHPDSPLMSGGSQTSSGSRPAGRALPVPGGQQSSSGEVFYQHTDSGIARVQELPPPYMPER